ncbi:signal peptidase I [Roseivirga pacifica]|uniref:Signal peptidase I n=1 Tax=Roseivirga pacifica TaxID=1267423 RepID=A0A1I0MFX0_9BACT|nr:signal peptidase I [Roseivirga pacifica]RKQ50304.1 signal peptidase I [Roseivirga pacifica]SEV86351.1 signal peptidase I [Roseivirga pacifica]
MTRFKRKSPIPLLKALSFVTLLVCLRLFVIEIVTVASSSMENTLTKGDILLVNKLHGEVKKGEITVFNISEPSNKLVKRCVATAGDIVRIDSLQNHFQIKPNVFPKTLAESSFEKGLITIEIPSKNRKYQINQVFYDQFQKTIRLYEGEILVKRFDEYLLNGKPIQEYTFKNNYLFFVGDNMDNSFDSRHFGPIPANNIFGRAYLLFNK